MYTVIGAAQNRTFRAGLSGLGRSKQTFICGILARVGGASIKAPRKWRGEELK